MRYFPKVSAISFMIISLSLPLASAQEKGMNPKVGVNFLGLYQKSVEGNTPGAGTPNGFSFQEAELDFSADVDPYLRGVGIFSIGEVEGTTPHDHEFAIEPEEVYLETISLPSWTLKLGKFKAAMGRHNALHTHAFPFIDAPLVNQQLLGNEGLNDIGASASALLPTSWFLELTAQALSSRSTPLYGSADPNALVGVAQLKNLWDLSDSTTVEFSLFGTTGKNASEKSSNVLGSDLTVKWRPTVGGKYRSLAWTTEYLRGLQASGERLGGLASWVQYQFAERWWIQGRIEQLGIPRDPSFAPKQKQSALLGFFPSEFSGYRLQHDHQSEAGGDSNHSVALQWNVSLGAHPAHAY
ncbi:hypothetical protein EBZ37_04900 [bacterium]|nr:hypothetical protein [bacterium]